MITNIGAQLEDIFSKRSGAATGNIIIHSDWNITTIFGVLLDYPVVYWYDDTINVTTCLPHQDLMNYQVINSFKAKNSILERIVYSFTVPICVISDSLRCSLDAWASKTCDSGKASNVILTCKKTEVNLSSVIL